MVILQWPRTLANVDVHFQWNWRSMPRTINENKRCTTRAICNARDDPSVHMAYTTRHRRLTALSAGRRLRPTSRPNGERERMSSSSASSSPWVRRSLEPCSGRAGRRGNATDNAVYDKTWLRAGKRGENTVPMETTESLHLYGRCTTYTVRCMPTSSISSTTPLQSTGTPVGSIGSRRRLMIRVGKNSNYNLVGFHKFVRLIRVIRKRWKRGLTGKAVKWIIK